MEIPWVHNGTVYPLSRDSQTQPSSVTLTTAPGLLPGTRAWPGPEERPWRTGSSGFKADHGRMLRATGAWKGSKNLCLWHLGTRVRGGLGSAGEGLGLDGFRGLFQPW